MKIFPGSQFKDERKTRVYASDLAEKLLGDEFSDEIWELCQGGKRNILWDLNWGIAKEIKYVSESR